MLVEWLWILVTSNVNFNSVRRKPRACERRLKNWSSGSLWSQNDGKMMGEWWKPQNFLQKFDGLYSIWVYSQVPKFFFLYFGIIVIPDFWTHPKEVKDGEFLHFLESQNQNSDSLPLDIDFSGGIQMLDGSCVKVPSALWVAGWFWMKYWNQYQTLVTVDFE